MKRIKKRIPIAAAAGLTVALLGIAMLGLAVSVYAEDGNAGDSAYTFDYHVYDSAVSPGTMSGYSEVNIVTVSGPDMSSENFDYSIDDVVVTEQQKKDPGTGDVVLVSRNEHGWGWQAESCGQAVLSLSIENPTELVERGITPQYDTLKVTLTVTEDEFISEEDAEANPDNDLRIWYTVTMKPGDVYDVSKAGWNTTVYISEPGDFTLKGQSETVRVIVESGDVDLYLADGLNINCTARSYAGTRTAPIWVRDVDGTIRILSKEDASVYLEGYMCPAIRKEGMKSKLVFDTENESVPGSIVAKAGYLSAAIGSVPYVNSNLMGNIEFNGGEITAETSAESAAAIGGGAGCDVQDITINGGDITAYAQSYGAVIGAGNASLAQNIVINGGNVYAENSGKHTGACIGSGQIDYDLGGNHVSATGIHINGGVVTAINHGPGAAIGSGEGAGVEDLQITGGIVHATSKSNGGPAIGAGMGNGLDISCEVKISGGIIDAYGSEEAPGIGTTENKNGGDNKCSIEISGGTVIARAGSDNHQYDIGGHDPDHSTVVITGGSVNAGGISGKVVNGNNDAVHPVEVTFTQVAQNSIYNILRDMVCSNGYSYGMQQVVLTDMDSSRKTGKFYPWLPATDEAITSIMSVEELSPGQTEDILYSGNIAFKDAEGTMKPSTEALAQLLPDPVTLADENLVDYIINVYLALTDEELMLVSEETVSKLAAADDVISQGKAAAKSTKVTSANNLKGKKALVRWKAASGVTGYKISCSTSKNFKKGVKTKKVSAKAKKLTLKKLRKGKTYYFKVRPYTKVTNRITGESKVILGKALNQKKVKIRK